LVTSTCDRGERRGIAARLSARDGARRLAIALAATAALAVACAEETPPLTWEILSNATYQSENALRGSVPLTDGEYVDEPNRVRVILPRRFVAGGDMDGDGVLDAAVILVANTGGTGVFHELCVVLNRGGSPEQVATAGLGDRVKIESFRIEAGEVVVDMIVHGPADPMCCPTQRELRRYRVEDDRLRQVTVIEGGQGSEER
jgi:hypothetical protein